MRNKSIGLIASILIVTVAGTAMAMHKDKKKSVSTKQKDESVNTTNIKSVLMGRSACFGKCPTYSIEVFENGLIRYTGKDFVAKIGNYEKMIPAVNAIGFLKEFNTLQPDTLHYMYETKIADLPGIYYFITYPDSVKRVINADAGPRILRDWALKFDSLSKVDDIWVKKEVQK
ncbi:MAG: hypothetical protein IT256_07230 [Chitinophagaceae bacterium]|nr:hypothetical protein [Chitinophagaceae bacterium]